MKPKALEIIGEYLRHSNYLARILGNKGKICNRICVKPNGFTLGTTKWLDMNDNSMVYFSGHNL